MIIGLKRYKNAVRWKEHLLPKNSETSDNPSEIKSDNLSVETTNSSIHSENSLNTHLKPNNKSKNVPPGTPALEAFFKELEALLFNRLDRYYDDKTNKKAKISTSSDINQLLGILRKSSKLAVPTDKKSFKIIEIKDYKSQRLQHLEKSAVEVPRSRLVEISENTKELLNIVGHIIDDKKVRVYQRDNRF